MNREPDAYTLAEHARLLGYSQRTVENRVAAGSWPARTIKLGGRRLVPRVEHERVLREAMARAGIELEVRQTQPQQAEAAELRARARPGPGPGRPRRSVAAVAEGK